MNTKEEESTSKRFEKHNTRRFCIVTAGRTGSTRLRLLLDSHPSIRCHGEVFGENLSTLAFPKSMLYRSCLAERDSSPVGFLQERVFAPYQAEVVGFKILYEQLLFRWPGLLEFLKDDCDLQIIHLVRRNGLKRFLSEYFVGTITFQHQCTIDQLPPTVEPVHISIDDLLCDLNKVAAQEKLIAELFCNNTVFKLAYEDSLDVRGGCILGLQKFLGVEPANLTAPIQKILPSDLTRLIKNIDEVKSALRGSLYEFTSIE